MRLPSIALVEREFCHIFLSDLFLLRIFLLVIISLLLLHVDSILCSSNEKSKTRDRERKERREKNFFSFNTIEQIDSSRFSPYCCCFFQWTTGFFVSMLSIETRFDNYVINIKTISFWKQENNDKWQDYLDWNKHACVNGKYT